MVIARLAIAVLALQRQALPGLPVERAVGYPASLEPMLFGQVTLVGVLVVALAKSIAGTGDIRGVGVVAEVGLRGAQQAAILFHCGRELFRLLGQFWLIVIANDTLAFAFARRVHTEHGARFDQLGRVAIGVQLLTSADHQASQPAQPVEVSLVKGLFRCVGTRFQL
ncbi:hypothetical protein D3C81_1669240 [compost metagenome]